MEILNTLFLDQFSFHLGNCNLTEFSDSLRLCIFKMTTFLQVGEI